MIRKKIETFDIVNIIFLFGLVIITLFPFLYIINISLSSPLPVMKGDVSFWPKGFTLDAYKVILSDERVHNGYINTTLYTVVGTFISLILTAMGAYPLSRKEFMLNRTFTLLIVFTMLFNGGMIPSFLVVRELGIMNSIWAMVLPAAISVWNLLIMRTFFMGMPNELFDSGKMDGLTDLGVFWHIVLPLSKPVLATIGLFYAVAIWNNFFLAMLYLRDAELFPLQVMLRNMVLAGQMENHSMQSSDDALVISRTLKYATIMVTTLPILIVYPFIQKYFVKGALIGSVKG